MAKPISLNLAACLKDYQRLYVQPIGPRADVIRRRLPWRLARLSPKEQDAYYAQLVAWKVTREQVVAEDPGLSWEGIA